MNSLTEALTQLRASILRKRFLPLLDTFIEVNMTISDLAKKLDVTEEWIHLHIDFFPEGKKNETVHEEVIN